MNYYVYYKLDPARADEFRRLIHSLFDLVENQFGIRGRWMQRRDDPATYMEVYEGVKDEAAFEALLEREASRFGLQRRVERFVCV